MDVQGVRFHLLFGERDWRACSEVTASGPVGAVLGADHRKSPTSFGWSPATGSLRLAHRDPVVRRHAATSPRTADERRGAGRDRYGTWYWITADRRGIVHLAPGHATALPWWSLDGSDPRCPPTGTFENVTDALPLEAELAGLAVTTGHYLAAGLVDEGAGGLLVFDLHGGGAPWVLRWPGDRVVTPFDLAATEDGEVLVLDRTHRTWWRLDRGFRLLAATRAGGPTIFQPDPPESPLRRGPSATDPSGQYLPATGPWAVVDPVAIEPGPDGTVLLLDRPPAGPSAVVIVRESGALGRLPIRVEARDPEHPESSSFTFDVVAQDLAFVPEGQGQERPLPGPMLYVADAQTTQVLAFRLRIEPPDLAVEPEYLPMRRWEARALIVADADVYYDAVGRWVPLEPFGSCTFERYATLRTPAAFLATETPKPVPGQPFDSGRPGCTWHRLFLDADIPEGSALTIAARACDDAALLSMLPFVDQPAPYLRSGGSELPWHDPWASIGRLSPRTGTWELLLQQVRGRYVEFELTLVGTGRTTPTLRALRAWFPRFSYVSAYLPDVYQEEDEPACLLERLLANVEGYMTELEGKIEQASILFDPRTTPDDAVDWLGNWLGLTLEPAWTHERRRFLIRNADRFYRTRGTVAGLLSILRLYLGCRLDDSVFDSGQRRDDPARIAERFRARRVPGALIGDPSVAAAAHRFRVLVAADLSEERRAMVERIVAAAKPAHTDFELRSFHNLFVVGEARVGVDSQLGASPRFDPIVLGRTVMGAGTVAPDHPFGVSDRLVSDRDRLGELPPL